MGLLTVTCLSLAPPFYVALYTNKCRGSHLPYMMVDVDDYSSCFTPGVVYRIALVQVQTGSVHAVEAERVKVWGDLE